MDLMKKASVFFVTFCLSAAVFVGNAAGESDSERKMETLQEQMNILQGQMEALQKR